MLRGVTLCRDAGGPGSCAEHDAPCLAAQVQMLQQTARQQDDAADAQQAEDHTAFFTEHEALMQVGGQAQGNAQPVWQGSI